MSAKKIANLVRGTSPWPGAYTGLECAVLKVLQAEVVEVCGGAPGEVLSIEKDGIIVGTGENALRLITVQREGKKALPSFDCAQGLRLKPGQRLSDD
jgi:methionyl-tRNA formyltransferase